jgi:hypothetical protein
MDDSREMVVLELDAGIRMRLADQIARQMNARGFGTDFKMLNLGFNLPVGWPVDMKAQPTVSQLVVIVAKLKMRMIIDDLNLVPR